MSNYLNTFEEIKTEMYDVDLSEEKPAKLNNQKEIHYSVPQSLWDKIKSLLKNISEL